MEAVPRGTEGKPPGLAQRGSRRCQPAPGPHTQRVLRAARRPWGSRQDPALQFQEESAPKQAQMEGQRGLRPSPASALKTHAPCPPEIPLSIIGFNYNPIIESSYTVYNNPGHAQRHRNEDVHRGELYRIKILGTTERPPLKGRLKTRESAQEPGQRHAPDRWSLTVSMT